MEFRQGFVGQNAEEPDHDVGGGVGWAVEIPAGESVGEQFVERALRVLPESVFRSTPPTIELRGMTVGPDKKPTADWRQQSRDQKRAINQVHIAAISDYFRGAKSCNRASRSAIP